MSTSHPSPGPTPGRIRHHVRSLDRLVAAGAPNRVLRPIAYRLAIWGRTHRIQIEVALAEFPAGAPHILRAQERFLRRRQSR